MQLPLLRECIAIALDVNPDDYMSQDVEIIKTAMQVSVRDDFIFQQS
jgi:hypothetical protein